MGHYDALIFASNLFFAQVETGTTGQEEERSLLELLIPIPNIIETFFNMFNDWLCDLVDVVLSIWPSTPSTLNLGALLAQSFSETPMGSAIVAEVFNTVIGALTLVIFVKIYKLIPFKAT